MHNSPDPVPSGGISLRKYKSDGTEFFFYDDDRSNENIDRSSENSDEEDFGEVNERVKTLRCAPGANTKFEEIAVNFCNVDSGGMVKKLVIKHGFGDVIPGNAIVTYDFEMYLEGSEQPFDCSYRRGRPAICNLKKYDIILGFEIALSSMKKKENSQFLFNWRVAFGKTGVHPEIPPKADLFVNITVKDYPLPLSSAIDGDDEKFAVKIKEVQVLHHLGNDAYKSKKYQIARKNYFRAVNILNKMQYENAEEEKEGTFYLVKCNMNLAMAQLQLNKPREACISCQTALIYDPNNAKTIFQYGKALLKLGDYKRSRSYLLKAAKLVPNDPSIAANLKELEEREAVTSSHEMWRNVLVSKREVESPNSISKEEPKTPALETFAKDLQDSLKVVMNSSEVTD